MSQTSQEEKTPTFENVWTLENVNRLKNEFILNPNEDQFCFASKWFHREIWWWPETRIKIQARATEFLAEIKSIVLVGNFDLFRTSHTLINPRQIRFQFLDWEIARLEKLSLSASKSNTEEAG